MRPYGSDALNGGTKINREAVAWSYVGDLVAICKSVQRDQTLTRQSPNEFGLKHEQYTELQKCSHVSLPGLAKPPVSVSC